jgi:hypothetical protein
MNKITSKFLFILQQEERKTGVLRGRWTVILSVRVSECLFSEDAQYIPMKFRNAITYTALVVESWRNEAAWKALAEVGGYY